MNCTRCSSLLRSGIRFCTHCGAAIPAQPAERQSDPAPASEPVSHAPEKVPWALAILLVAAWLGRPAFEHSAGALLVVGLAVAAVEHDRDALAAALSRITRWDTLRSLRHFLAGIPLGVRLLIATVASGLAGFVVTPLFSAIFDGFSFFVGVATIAMSTVVAALVLDSRVGGDGGG